MWLFLGSSLGCNVILGLDGLEADRGAGSGSPGAAAPTGGSGGPGGFGGQGSECGGVCGEPGCGDCPEAPQIAVSATNGDYKIDKFEVTTAAYVAWLATRPSTADQHPRCTNNDSFVPGEISQAAFDAAMERGFMMIGEKCFDWLAAQTALDQDKAVACVDWCDAVAYCTWAKGRLCGRIGGGTLDITNPNQADSNNAQDSEWFHACSNNNTQEYPYAGGYSPGICNDGDSRVEAVGSRPDCVGGFAGIHDMSGNVLEWEDACTNYGGDVETENCVRRGGAYYSTVEDLACALSTEQQAGTLPGIPSDGTGFRCCSN